MGWAVAVIFAAGAVQAADPAAGKKKTAEVCASCHAADGNSTAPDFPKLAGQKEDYLLKALKDYKSGARKDPIMAGIVAGLSGEDLANLAAYFAVQRGLFVKY